MAIRQRVVNVRPLDASDIKDREREKTMLLGDLKCSDVRLIAVVGRSGIGKTALVSHVLAMTESRLRKLQEAENWYSDGVAPGLPPALYHRLRKTLLVCLPEDVYSLFIDQRVFPWRHSIPIDAAKSRESKVAALIGFLYNRHSTDGKNALVLFLHVLRDQFDSNDSWYEAITKLSNTLAPILEDSYSAASTPSDRQLSYQQDLVMPFDGILYLSRASKTGLGLECIYDGMMKMLDEEQAKILREVWENPNLTLERKIQSLLEQTQSGHFLVVLDGLLDDVVDLAPDTMHKELPLFFKSCLTQPGGIRLLTTSQKNVPIPPTALRHSHTIFISEGLPENDAVALLKDLDHNGYLRLQSASEEVLHLVAQRTLGIPRALELFAGILYEKPSLTPTRLLADRGLFNEHVVDNLVAESYKSLKFAEQLVMQALAVFSRPVTEEAITYLVNAQLPYLNIQDCLDHLVNGHLINVNHTLQEYSLHPLTGEYVYRQIPESTERSVYAVCDLERLAAEFYVGKRAPKENWLSINDLAPQINEIGHRLRVGDYDEACRVLNLIDEDYLHQWGHYGLLRELREGLEGKLTDSDLKVVNTLRLGGDYRVLGQLEKAIMLYEQALATARANNDRTHMLKCLSNLGNAYRSYGDMSKSIEYLEQAWDMAREDGNRKAESRIVCRLGTTLLEKGDIDRACTLYEKSLQIAAEINDNVEKADACGHLGRGLYALGKTDEAIARFVKALQIDRETGFQWHEVVRLNNLGDAHLSLGEVEQAMDYYTRALSIAEEIQYAHGKSYQLLGLGKVALAQAKYSEAEKYCLAALSHCRMPGHYPVNLLLGIAYLGLCEWRRALSAFSDAEVDCQSTLKNTQRLYKTFYALAASQVGIAVCSPDWAKEQSRRQLLEPALEVYAQASEICSTLGVVRDNLWELNILCRTGVEGLDPVLFFLEGLKHTKVHAGELF